MLKAADVARLLGLSARTVYALAQAGALPHFRPALGAVRFDPADVEAYRQSCRSTATPTASAGAMNFRASLTDDDAALQSYFQRRGRAPRQKPTPPSATPTSTLLHPVPSGRSR
jgi:excisionase family DNA binding protein